ncbi:hypothetical protein B0H14DRAFT_2605068 [Mycena olivaceomarginata]|nr:hypothetical protein B0H14DRAFT_2605068 [Mycena olivaceomarginata]
MGASTGRGVKRVQEQVWEQRESSAWIMGIERADGGERTRWWRGVKRVQEQVCGQRESTAWMVGIERAANTVRDQAAGGGQAARGLRGWGAGDRIRMGCAMNGQAARIKGSDSERERAGEGGS